MILNQHFTLDRIGQIVGENPATIRTHINRGYVLGQGPRNAAADKDRGKHERFSVHSLMEFALAYRIEASGMSLKLAFQYAADFAHSGGSDFATVSGGMMVQRLPGLPFHHRHGSTWMGMMRGRTAEAAGDSALSNLHLHLRNRTGASPSEPLTVTNLSALFREVCAALGADAREVLDEVYSQEDEW